VKRTLAGNGPQEKPRGDERRAARIPEETWQAIEEDFVLAVRPAIVRLVRDVRADEHRLSPAAMRAWRRLRRGSAERAAGAARDFLRAINVLRWVRLDALVEYALPPLNIERDAYLESNETMTAFRADLARLEARWQSHLLRLQGRTEWLARQSPPRGRPSNVLRDAVIERLIHIAKTYRRNPRDALLKREGDLPGGVLYKLGAILRPWLSSLPSGDEGLYKALGRALGRARRGQKSRPPRKSVPRTPR
jgi:hypothetical protein